ncbi:chitinase [Streptomyces cavernae]|uniref:chitinase n=1 Tax=Streptomyces cavernae TaxID=2259034 RepID=UPI000FEC1AB2|nr:chitinase [Streptomyces cavernae]
MRSFLKPAAGLVCLLALASAGCSSGGDESSDAGTPKAPDSTRAAPSEPAQDASSSTTFAPYVSASSASDLDAAGSPSTYNLAFVVAKGNSCTPVWDASTPIDNSAVTSRISALTKSGASVRVSFGGASGTELAEACDSASELAAAYGKALDAAGATQADFDVEGDALKDSDSVELRSKAIALLQKERSGLKVSFTLPVMPTGLDSDSKALLDSANNNGVQVSTVNIMTMNYGESYRDDMGDYAITSAEAAHDQLADIFGLSDADAWRGMALTSMLGDNDIKGETFTLDDAAQVRSFAEEKGIAWVSMWATFRDRQCDSGDSSSNDALTNCSGVEQEDGAFGKAFAG